ncbi:MAG TPA: discoidin domain-containing protein, partial [Bacteroidota bacterium]|nr:discoidin domain-containing protein [Bacteroidota bacterium]
GFWGPDLVATIDMQRPETFSKVTLDVFIGEGSWIYPPKGIEVFISSDSVNFTRVKKFSSNEIMQMGNVITMNLGEQTARYIRVIAENAGKIPEGKPGAGIDAWLFVDEIIVE